MSEITTIEKPESIIGRQIQPRGWFPFYGWLAAGIIVGAELLLFSGIRFIGVFFTPIVWTGYILLVDALLCKIRGESYIAAWTGDFLLMLPISVFLWLIFEGYNLFIDNWHYQGLPQNLWLRCFGFAWSFATIWPAILLTNELLATLGAFGRATSRPICFSALTRKLLIWVGAVFLIIPILFPSRWWAALVWTGFIFLLDPLNDRYGAPSLINALQQGRPQILYTLMFSGLICGILWEFWNFWAIAKWIYTVPILGHIKIFEMPVVGYLGFFGFALEVFVMYETVRLALRRLGAKSVR